MNAPAAPGPRELPDEAIVVRGGTSPIEAMKNSVARTLEKRAAKGEPAEYALSVFTDATRSLAEIVVRAPILQRWTQIRVSTVGALRARGFRVSHPDRYGHASLVFPGPPSDADYERLLDAFSEPIPKPTINE